MSIAFRHPAVANIPEPTKQLLCLDQIHLALRLFATWFAKLSFTELSWLHYILACLGAQRSHGALSEWPEKGKKRGMTVKKNRKVVLCISVTEALNAIWSYDIVRFSFRVYKSRTDVWVGWLYKKM